MTTLKSVSATNKKKITFVRVNSTGVKPQCAERLTEKMDIESCARLCVERNSSCLAIEHSGNNCTLFKIVNYVLKANSSKNLYLKDTSNTFSKDQCSREQAVVNWGKSIKFLKKFL